VSGHDGRSGAYLSEQCVRGGDHIRRLVDPSQQSSPRVGSSGAKRRWPGRGRGICVSYRRACLQVEACCARWGSINLQGWQGRSGSLTSAPRPATPGEISAPRPATPSDPAQVTTPGSLHGRAAALARPARLGHH
jgi:hypothetical protein